MIGAMTKKETGLFTLLVGILLGMLASIFMEYTIPVNKLNAIISHSCISSKAETVSISFFGKRVKVECSSGEVHHYNLWVLDRNSSNQNNNG
jgi:hypothetical protein